MEFYLPETFGGWLQFASAIITIFFGLLLLFAPRVSFRILRLQTHPDHPEAIAEGRGTMAGFYLGLGICCILFNQPLIWLALGISWGFTAFGRLISMMSDNGNTPYNWISLAMEVALAAMPVLEAFGYLGDA
jgi:cytochrome c biogenesis protein CcdA